MTIRTASFEARRVCGLVAASVALLALFALLALLVTLVLADSQPLTGHAAATLLAALLATTVLVGALLLVQRAWRLRDPLRDLSARLQQETALRQQLQRQLHAQAAMLREREAMLDVLAHEVRQPLNNASAAMQSAIASLHGVGEQAAAPRLARAQAVLGQVMARLDNTLAVASVLARQGPAAREDTDLDLLLAVTIADMADEDRPRIVVQRETAARTVSLDMGLMRLALRNLLSNALKYSPPGSTVTLCLADSEVPLGLQIDVMDRGGGIEAGLCDHLFERGARGRQTPGAEHGLGLYIVRRVMELHGGSVALVSTGVQGTTMRLRVAEGTDG